MNPFKKLKKQYQQAGSLKNLILHTAFALTFTSGLSYVFGLLRDRAFTTTFGASSDLDIYLAAFVVPDFFLALLVTGALSSAFVPIFSNFDEKDKQKAIDYTNQILSYGLLMLAVAGGIFALFLPYFAEYLVSGFNEEQLQDYIQITRWMLLSPVFFTISNTFGNMLISIKDFLWYGLAPVMYNIGILIGVYFFVPEFELFGLVLGTLLGAFFHLAIRLPSVIKYGFKFRFNFKFDGKMKETVGLMIPKMLQIGMWQILLWWFVRLATELPEGSVTIYSLSRNFQSAPVSLLGIAISLSAFAQLSHIAAKKDYKKFASTVRHKAGLIIFYTVLAAAFLAAFSKLIIGILLGGGEFGQEAVLATAAMLAVYSISIPFESVMHLLARSHFALKNTLRPSIIHISTISLTMIVSYILIPQYELFALPIAFTIGLIIQITLLFFSLRNLLNKKHVELAEVEV